MALEKINQLLKHINIKNTLNQETPLTQEDCHKILFEIVQLENQVKKFIDKND